MGLLLTKNVDALFMDDPFFVIAWCCKFFAWFFNFIVVVVVWFDAYVQHASIKHQCQGRRKVWGSGCLSPPIFARKGHPNPIIGYADFSQNIFFSTKIIDIPTPLQYTAKWDQSGLHWLRIRWTKYQRPQGSVKKNIFRIGWAIKLASSKMWM